MAESGSTLTFDGTVTLDNTTLTGSVTNNGTLKVDTSTTLTLPGTVISGGFVSDSGSIVVTAKAEIENATINSGGSITLDGATVSTASGAALALDNVTADGGTKFTVGNGAALGDSGSTLALENTTIYSGTFVLDPGASATTPDGVTQTQGPGTLVLEDSTLLAAAISGGGNVVAAVSKSGGVISDTANYIDSGTTISGGTVLAEAGTTLTLTGVDFTGGEAVAAKPATVSGTSLGGGILTLDNVSLGSEVVAASGSTVTLDGNSLVNQTTIVGSVTNNGTIIINDGITLTLPGTVINGGNGSEIFDGGSIVINGSPAKAEIENTFITGGGSITVVSGAKLAFDGDTVNVNSLTIDSGAVAAITGDSTIESTTIQGVIAVDSGGIVLTLDDVTFTGTSGLQGLVNVENSMTVAGGASLGLDGVALNTPGGNSVETIYNNGTIAAIVPSGQTVVDSQISNMVINGGELAAVSGVTLSLDDVEISGTTLVGNINLPDQIAPLYVNGSGVLGGAIVSGVLLAVNPNTVLYAQLAETTGTSIQLGGAGSALVVEKATSGSLVSNAHNGDVVIGNINLGGFGLVQIEQGATLVSDGEISPGSGLTPFVEIQNGGTMVDNGTVDAGVQVLFNGSSGTLVLDGLVVNGQQTFSGQENFHGTIDINALTAKPTKGTPMDVVVLPGVTIAQNSNGKNEFTTTGSTLNLSAFPDGGSNTINISNNGNVIIGIQETLKNGQEAAVVFEVTQSAAKGPAGIAGSPINLALSEPSSTNGEPISVAVSGLPTGWSLNEGKSLGNGTWAVEAQDLSGLSVTTPAAFTGAAVLHVMETWTNADGSTGTKSIAENVEAYGPGNPIFALAHNDSLTGTGANNTFVFAQTIGNDTINNFNVASDKIDLTGFAGVDSFGDLHIANDASGNAVITLGSGETITLDGVNASALSAADFVFNETPTTNNSGTMTIGNGAVLPLGGIVNNTGTIALDSTGHKAELQIAGDGITLQGGGQVTLSGHALIAGTGSTATLTNVDNTISGAGQIGAGDGATAANGTGVTLTAGQRRQQSGHTDIDQ